MPQTQAWEAETPCHRQSFPLCRRCYSNLYFRSTQEGQLEIAKLIDQNTPVVYRKGEFNTLECSGQYGQYLNGVRQHVIRWAMEYAQGQSQKRSL